MTTTTDVRYPYDDFNISRQKNEPSYKILLRMSEPEPFVRLESYGRGGGARAKYHKIREIYIDNDKRVFAGFEATDKDGHFYQYVIIGQLQVIPSASNGREAI